MLHISSQTKRKIRETLGFDFEFVSFSTFEYYGAKRCTYTVRRPNGKKLYHLIGHESGEIVKA